MADEAGDTLTGLVLLPSSPIGVDRALKEREREVALKECALGSPHFRSYFLLSSNYSTGKTLFSKWQVTPLYWALRLSRRSLQFVCTFGRMISSTLGQNTYWELYMLRYMQSCSAWTCP